MSERKWTEMNTTTAEWWMTAITHYSYIIDEQIINESMNKRLEGYLIAEMYETI